MITKGRRKASDLVMGEKNSWRKKIHNENNFNEAYSMILRSLAARTKEKGADCIVQLSLSMKEREVMDQGQPNPSWPYSSILG